MTDTLTQVAFFHEAFGLPVVSHPSIPSDDRVALRLRLIGARSAGEHPQAIGALGDVDQKAVPGFLGQKAEADDLAGGG